MKVEKISVQGDHLHLVVRTTQRSGFQHFLRVFSGQMAQQMEHMGLLKLEHDQAVTSTRAGPHKEQERPKLWKYRPFTRVVKGYRAYLTLRNYVQLNEREAEGRVPYRKERLRGLKDDEWRALWS